MKTMKLTGVAMLFAIITISLSSCTSVSTGSYRSASGSQEKEITIGKVQKEIRKGMSGAEVAEILGSPNIVTKDEAGLETWVYDRIATEANYSESANALFLVLYAQGQSSSRATVTQRTLTVVVKLNNDAKVESFSYHASRF